MIQWIRNKIAAHVATILYWKLPFNKDIKTEKIRAWIIGSLAYKSKPTYYIYWDEKEQEFRPGIKNE